VYGDEHDWPSNLMDYRNQIIPHPLKKSLAVMKSTGLLPCCHVSVICPYTEPDQFIPHYFITVFKIQFLILSSNIHVHLFPSDFPIKTCHDDLFSVTCVLPHPAQHLHLTKYTGRMYVIHV